MTPTYIRKRKRPAGCGLWPSYLMDTDAFGTWFYTPAHSLVTEDERAAAVDAAEMLEHAFRTGAEPFGRAGWEQLAAAVALGLPPLTDFADRPLG
ncbi:hypothetical protein ACWGID_02135 [Kribbella sp. NPDC054772]